MNAHAGGPKLPWDGKAQRADKVLVAAIMISGIYGLATMPLIPMLIDSHPVLLAAIRGGMTSIVNLGALASIGEVNVLVAIFVGLPASIMFDWAYWWAGQRWGERALHLILGESRKTEARLATVKRWTEKYGPFLVLLCYFQPIPNPLIYAAAGWAGMRLATFLVLDVLSALLWVGLCAGLGYWIGQPAVDVVDQIGKYSLWLTIALVVVIVARQVLVTRRQIKSADAAARAEKAARESEQQDSRA
jgi:membrane-associated protein